MVSLISACGRCWSLRSDPIPANSVVAGNAVWHGVCRVCMEVRLFEVVGTVNYVSNTTPVSEEE